jgi:hypothetical protein
MEKFKALLNGDPEKVKAIQAICAGTYNAKKCPKGLKVQEVFQMLALIAGKFDYEEINELRDSCHGVTVPTPTPSVGEGSGLDSLEGLGGDEDNVLEEDLNLNSQTQSQFKPTVTIEHHSAVVQSAAADESSSDKRPICKSTRLGMVCMVDGCNKRHFPPCMV